MEGGRSSDLVVKKRKRVRRSNKDCVSATVDFPDKYHPVNTNSLSPITSLFVLSPALTILSFFLCSLLLLPLSSNPPPLTKGLLESQRVRLNQTRKACYLKCSTVPFSFCLGCGRNNVCERASARARVYISNPARQRERRRQQPAQAMSFFPSLPPSLPPCRSSLAVSLAL